MSAAGSAYTRAVRTHPALFALPLLLGCAHRLQIPQPPPAGPGAVLPPLPAASIDLPLRAGIWFALLLPWAALSHRAFELPVQRLRGRFSA